MLMTQVFVNVGGNVGIMPITGIPLPLMSYGGSSVIVTPDRARHLAERLRAGAGGGCRQDRTYLSGKALDMVLPQTRRGLGRERLFI